MNRSLIRLAALAALLAMANTTRAANTALLDPLSWQEHWVALQVLRAGGWLKPETLVPIVRLQEPSKDVVLGDAPATRTAYVLLRTEAENLEALVDLETREARVHPLSGTQPNWATYEYESPNEVVFADPDFLAALQQRGIDVRAVDCESLPPGFPASPDEAGRRIGHVTCVLQGPSRNEWTRVIEGLIVVFDLDSNQVLRVVDEGVVPQPTVTADFDPSAIGPPRAVPGPIMVSQPNGPGFTLDGHTVRWQNWSFHLRSDVRSGVIVSLVDWHDGDTVRPVMYRGNLSDIYVPYMDPGFAWSARTYLDTGEYAAGGILKPMIEGVDCPQHAHYMNAVVSGDGGRPVDEPRVICLFEREAGDMAWRHNPADGSGAQGRVRRDLVVRSASVFGNYDYIFDWIFRQDGSIEVKVGATGIVAVKAVDPASAIAEADAWGRLVDPGIVAVNHDHFFNFRLDLDVDGRSNSFTMDRLVNEPLAEGHPRAALWAVEPRIARTESEAKMTMRLDRPMLWRVVNPSRPNHVGHPVSYQLKPGMNTTNLQPAEDITRQRAGFADHHLWVTPYDPAELYAAGDFPTLSAPRQGLPAYTAGNRAITNRDLVLWYTFGMHHVVRAEDWPVMPVTWSGFEIRPFDFFAGNPALDLPD